MNSKINVTLNMTENQEFFMYHLAATVVKNHISSFELKYSKF